MGHFKLSNILSWLSKNTDDNEYDIHKNDLKEEDKNIMKSFNENWFYDVTNNVNIPTVEEWLKLVDYNKDVLCIKHENDNEPLFYAQKQYFSAECNTYIIDEYIIYKNGTLEFISGNNDSSKKNIILSNEQCKNIEELLVEFSRDNNNVGENFNVIWCMQLLLDFNNANINKDNVVVKFGPDSILGNKLLSDITNILDEYTRQ